MLTQELMNTGLQRRTDLALAVLHELAVADTALSGITLAGNVGTTVTYLPQVVSPLVHAGWVRSNRGPGGGYRLTAAGHRARMLDVIETVQGPLVDGQCALRDAPCPGSEICTVHAIWSEARQVLIEGLADLPAISA